MVKHSSLKPQLKFPYMLIFPITFQTQFFTTNAGTSPEGICNGKYNRVAGLILRTLLKSILEEHNFRISTSTVKKAPPHSFFSSERKWTLWLIPPPRIHHSHNLELQTLTSIFSTPFKPGIALWFYTSNSRKRAFQKL